MRSSAFVIAPLIFVGCAAPATSQGEELELGFLRVGRESAYGGVHYTLSARFDVSGAPTAFELDTEVTHAVAERVLAMGNYAITIRSDFTVWRDVAVAQLEVPADLACAQEQRFAITAGSSTLIAYAFMVEGKTIVFEAL